MYSLLCFISDLFTGNGAAPMDGAKRYVYDKFAIVALDGIRVYKM